MSTLELADRTAVRTMSKGSVERSSHALRAAPHIVVWALLLAPMARAISRGWRPLADDAAIAIGAWKTLTLHPPLLGQLTTATGGTNASDPGPLEYWLLGPFVHLDHGQGALIGSTVLCGLILSVTLEVLRRTSGTWAVVVFTLVVVDLAIVSPTPFVDPVWNSSFGFFWFIAFLGIAFTVGRGHFRYFPLLLFVGSVSIDSHLEYLPTIGLLLVAVLVVGRRARVPTDHHWVRWTAVVAVVCWVGPLYQQFFADRPNLSLLLRPPPKTEGWAFGLRALSRVVSLNPIWASPRPIGEFTTAYNDFAHRNTLLGVVVIGVLVAIAIGAWKRNDSALVSMCTLSLAGGLGVVFLFSRAPANDFLAFIWINVVVWVVGVCIWVTLFLAVVTALRPQFATVRDQVSEVRAQLGRRPNRFSKRQRRSAAVAALGVAGLLGTLVTVFPYGNQFLVDWPAVARVQQMTSAIQRRVPHGNVGIGILYKGPDIFRSTSDAHGVAYLLLVGGWNPGLEPEANQLLGMPIDTKSPFLAFRERGNRVTGTTYFPVYQPFWFSETR